MAPYCHIYGQLRGDSVPTAVVPHSIRVLLLLPMAIYASASVALDLKASNLTHRGIISHGTYRFIRHSAYICRNLAWSLGVGPAIIANWGVSVWNVFMILVSTGAWTPVYALHAHTE